MCVCVCVRDSCWSTVMFELHCTEFVFTFKHVDAPAGVMTSQLVQSQSGARMKLGMDFSVTQETFCVQMLNFHSFIHGFRVFHDEDEAHASCFYDNSILTTVGCTMDRDLCGLLHVCFVFDIRVRRMWPMT